MQFQPSVYSGKSEDLGDWSDTFLSFFPTWELGTKMGKLAAWATAPSVASMSLEDLLKGLTEAEIRTVAQLTPFAKISGEALRKEVPSAAASSEMDIEKAVSRAFGSAQASPQNTSTAILSALTEIRGIAVRQKATKLAESVLTALKWVSTNSSEISKASPKAEGIPTGTTPGTSPEPGQPGQPPADDKSLFSQPWFWVAVGGTALTAGGAYYYFYIRPKR